MFDDGLTLNLIAALYDAALDGRLWPEVLNRIGDAVGGSRVAFGIFDPVANLVRAESPRTDPDIVRSYVEYWGAFNPLWPRSSQVTPGKLFLPSDFMPLEEFTATTFYQEWWRPAEFDTAPLATNLFVEGSASAVLSCYKSPGAADTNSAQRRLFETLVPHAIRSVMLHRRLHHLELGQEAAVRGLDHLQQGLLFVDSQARVLFANNTARKMLDARDGLRLEDGCLSAAAVDQGHRLRRVVASCVDDSSVANGPGGEVDLARDGRLPLHAVVMPLADESAAIHLPWIALSRPVAMVLVSDPEAELQTRVKRQCKRFGFTAAETTFALEIVSGGGRRAAAERLGITVTTARTHLSSIFEKTGTHRQAELVYLLLRPV